METLINNTIENLDLELTDFDLDLNYETIERFEEGIELYIDYRNEVTRMFDRESNFMEYEGKLVPEAVEVVINEELIEVELTEELTDKLTVLC